MPMSAGIRVSSLTPPNPCAGNSRNRRTALSRSSSTRPNTPAHALLRFRLSGITVSHLYRVAVPRLDHLRLAHGTVALTRRSQVSWPSGADVLRPATAPGGVIPAWCSGCGGSCPDSREAQRTSAASRGYPPRVRVQGRRGPPPSPSCLPSSTRLGCQGTWSQTTAVKMRSSLRMAATSATFLCLPRRHKWG